MDLILRREAAGRLFESFLLKQNKEFISTDFSLALNGKR